MFKKLIYFSNQQINLIKKDAEEREISFTEMVRRILDKHYSLIIPEISTDSTCFQGPL